MFPTDERERRAATSTECPAGLELASIGRRAGGAIIDQLLVVTPIAAAAALSGYRPGDTVSDDALLVMNIALAVAALTYETLLIGFFGRTVGKIVTGTRVVHQADGGKVGWFAALQRAMVPVVFSGVPQVGVFLGGIVYTVAYLGPLRQGIHDRAAGTLVVRNGVITR